MRQYETREQTSKYNHLVKLTCDLCGTNAKSGGWESSLYEVNEVEIEMTVRQKDGQRYAECGSGEQYIVDLCPQCFKQRLIPWLHSEGATIEQKEWDW